MKRSIVKIVLITLRYYFLVTRNTLLALVVLIFPFLVLVYPLVVLVCPLVVLSVGLFRTDPFGT